MHIELANWQRDEKTLFAIRQEVFVREQHVSQVIEWDGKDADATHFLAWENGQAIATARLLVDGKLGRMAVLAPWRGQGVGGLLLNYIVQWARERNYPQVYLNAQVHALGFYQRAGFKPRGAEFFEAGIAHRSMLLGLEAEVS